MLVTVLVSWSERVGSHLLDPTPGCSIDIVALHETRCAYCVCTHSSAASTHRYQVCGTIFHLNSVCPQTFSLSVNTPFYLPFRSLSV